MVKQQKRDVAEVKKTEAEVTDLLSSASKNIVSMYEELNSDLSEQLSKVQTDLEENKRIMQENAQELAHSRDLNKELSEKIDVLIKDNNELTCRVQELERGITILTTQLKELNATPRWRERKKSD